MDRWDVVGEFDKLIVWEVHMAFPGRRRSDGQTSDGLRQFELHHCSFRCRRLTFELSHVVRDAHTRARTHHTPTHEQTHAHTTHTTHHTRTSQAPASSIRHRTSLSLRFKNLAQLQAHQLTSAPATSTQHVTLLTIAAMQGAGSRELDRKAGGELRPAFGGRGNRLLGARAAPGCLNKVTNMVAVHQFTIHQFTRECKGARMPHGMLAPTWRWTNSTRINYRQLFSQFAENWNHQRNC
jgi:hypothetical protein